jgi:hypothetical protein
MRTASVHSRKAQWLDLPDDHPEERVVRHQLEQGGVGVGVDDADAAALEEAVEAVEGAAVESRLELVEGRVEELGTRRQRARGRGDLVRHLLLLCWWRSERLTVRGDVKG